VKGLELLTTHGKHMNIYNIGSPTETKILEIIRTLAAIMDMSITIKPSPVPEGSVARRAPDITKLKKLGFRPEISLKKGLYETYAWYKKHI
jgi:UDP-glucose 4-epimerase/UDP-glucuronate decarboxylase